MLDGDLTPAEYRAEEARYLEYRGLRSAQSDGPANSDVAEADTTAAVMASVSGRTLPLTHYPQNTNYYCGPATGKMLVKITDGSIASRHNGVSFTQGHFAGNAHMETDARGATNWSTGLFVRGVNRWRGQNWYVQVDAPSASLMMSVLTQSIGNNGMPVAADTVEWANGAHYNGHPVGSTIGHWILAYGYGNLGGTVQFADPSTSVWGAAGPTFSASTSTFTNTFLQTNGIAY
ncbi:hypothetical protein ACJ5H2_05370 [Nocardioides sp. R1-1]|uniref:hypothetical protein n=1 Tax=Nocardioides sp. R1-1 TaxID=3383502 RepID=UPI0038CF5A0D